jgi:hypothetical protein
MITIVSGLPRSGTSLMMQMLQAGGIPVLTDHIRTEDESNPCGYLEYEPVRTLPRNSTWVEQAEGHVVKVISQLLSFWPATHNAQIIFMERRLEEVIESQQRMLTRMGKSVPAGQPDVLRKAFQQHLAHIRKWIPEQPNLDVLFVDYGNAVTHPRRVAQQVADWLEPSLAVEAMFSVVDPTLYRCRKTSD